MDEALDEAVRTFAPRIHTPRRPTLIVEVPAAMAGDLMRRLQTLQRLYPELSLAQNQALADSRERFLVVQPGALAKLGLRPGICWVSRGRTARAARRSPARRARRPAAGRGRSRRPALHPEHVNESSPPIQGALAGERGRVGDHHVDRAGG